MNYFSKEELSCSCCGEYATPDWVLDALNKFREMVGGPVVINSAYRCPSHNKNVGGAKNSMHLKGIAFDVRIDGRDIKRLVEYAYKCGANGVGLYDTFIHIDFREKETLWDNRTK